VYQAVGLLYGKVGGSIPASISVPEGQVLLLVGKLYEQHCVLQSTD